MLQGCLSAQGACHKGASSSKDGGRPEGTPSPASPDTRRDSWPLAAPGPTVTAQALPVVIVTGSPGVIAPGSPGVPVPGSPGVLVPEFLGVPAEASLGESMAHAVPTEGPASLPGPDSGLWPWLRSPPGPSPVSLWPMGVWYRVTHVRGWPGVSSSCPAAMCAGTAWTEGPGVPNPQAL